MDTSTLRRRHVHRWPGRKRGAAPRSIPGVLGSGDLRGWSSRKILRPFPVMVFVPGGAEIPSKGDMTA